MVSAPAEGGAGFEIGNLFDDCSPIIIFSPFTLKGESSGRRLRDRAGAGVSARLVCVSGVVA